jgi:hypothetical protein
MVVYTYLASSVRAIIPEAIGVAALVPPKEDVHSPSKAVVLTVDAPRELVT